MSIEQFDYEKVSQEISRNLELSIKIINKNVQENSVDDVLEISELVNGIKEKLNTTKNISNVPHVLPCDVNKVLLLTYDLLRKVGFSSIDCKELKAQKEMV